MLKIKPYKSGSQSAKLLARGLGVKRLRDNSRYVPPRRATILNWGSSKNIAHGNVLNRPEAVRSAINKLSAFQLMKAANLATVPFTSDKRVAQEWQEDGYRVVARTVLNGHSGAGIIVVQSDDSLPHAPLYTRYSKKTNEYRVHIFKGRIIDVCEKRRRSGTEGNSLVRTLNNGWVYCRGGVNLADVGRKLAIDAVSALGLDFGAVDLIMKDGKHLLLEVNTSPGLAGTTLQNYINALRQYV